MQIFRLSTARIKIYQIPHVIFGSFSPNFASLFNVMTYNSSEIFLLKHYMLWTKRAHKSTVFQIFECFNESLPSSSRHF